MCLHLLSWCLEFKLQRGLMKQAANYIFIVIARVMFTLPATLITPFSVRFLSILNFLCSAGD